MFCVIMMSFRNVVNTLENMDVGKIIHVVRLVQGHSILSFQHDLYRFTSILL